MPSPRLTCESVHTSAHEVPAPRCLSSCYRVLKTLNRGLTGLTTQCSPLIRPIHHIVFYSFFSTAITMSFQDIESGTASPSSTLRISSAPQSQEESAFLTLQSSLSLQVFKINSNVQGILKLVDQLGTGRDSGGLRKSLYVLWDLKFHSTLVNLPALRTPDMT